MLENVCKAHSYKNLLFSIYALPSIHLIFNVRMGVVIFILNVQGFRFF